MHRSLVDPTDKRTWPLDEPYKLGATRAVMIGDQLETDIKGARAAGLDAVWIETGVTAAIPDDTPAHLRPTWRMSGFVAAPQEMRP